MQPHLEEFWKLETTGKTEPCKETDDNKTSIKLWNTRKEDVMYNGHGIKMIQSSQAITHLHMADYYQNS